MNTLQHQSFRNMILGDFNESDSSSSDEASNTLLTHSQKQTFVSELIKDSKPVLTLREKKVAAMVAKFK